MITFADLFCGIGGFRLGIERASEKLGIPVQCVFSSEIEKNARYVYGNHYHHQPSGDITQINATDIPDMDILCGGFPCQAFSICGNKRGFEDTRGTLFFDIARILESKKPKIVFLENVKNILSHDRGRTFARILVTLYELGYDVECQLLNSKDFGVPQNRERVYIIGHSRRERTRQIFPIFGETGATTRKNSSTCLDANYWKGFDKHGQRTGIIQYFCGYHQQDRVLDPSGISSCLPTGTGGDLIPKFVIPNYSYVSYGFIDSLDPSLIEFENYSLIVLVNGRRFERETLDDGSLGSWREVTYSAIRKLTPVECERLQSFPDGWTEGISDSARYKCLGNAVTVNVIEAIAKKILKEVALHGSATNRKAHSPNRNTFFLC